MKALALCLATVVIGLGMARADDKCNVGAAKIPPDINEIFSDERYKGAIWGLRVVDFDTGETLIDLRPECHFFIGSVRKVFSVGELLNDVGPEHRYDTPIYRHGELEHNGVLAGDLILVASGDLTMGGRTNSDGSIAVSDFDHNEANNLGNAVLTKPDPLAGYRMLALQVLRAGVRRVKGDVVIDDRLFQPFEFRKEFEVRPIFVNDDAVDVSMTLGEAAQPATVMTRPISAALHVESTLRTGPAGSADTLNLEPKLPQCIGQRNCVARVTGSLRADFVPPLTNAFPYVQTFRIVQPANYARTVLIEALEAVGVRVDAPKVAENPVQLLPAKGSYPPDTKVAEMRGLPYSDDAKLILKISYNIGADTSLLLLGVRHHVDTMNDALELERQILPSLYGIPVDEFEFVDGSGGGNTNATTGAVTKMLMELRQRPAFPVLFDALPILGVDGSLGFVKDFQSDPTLAGATGQVRAKTGTFALPNLLKGQAFGGYITTRSGKHLVYEVVVNNVPIADISGVIQVFQDEGVISAILWRDN